MTVTRDLDTRASDHRSTPSTRRRLLHTAPLAVDYVVLTIVALIFLLPLWWLLIGALKTNAEIYQWPPNFLPTSLHWQNFADAWQSAPFGQYLFNSLFTTIVSSVVKVTLACTTAYAFVFLRFPLKNLLFTIMLAVLMMPGNLSLIVNYLTISELGWLNTYAALIVPGVASVFGTFMLRQHMLTLPRELLEAAEIDGAGHVRRLISVVIPLSRPTVLTVGLIAVIDEWNSFIWPLIVTNTDARRTLPVGLLFLKSEEGIGNWGVLMAGTVIVVIPMLIVFLFAQRYIVSGLTQGALKG